MTFKHKLSVRLALMRDIAMAVPAALILACAPGDRAFAPGYTPLADVTQSLDTVFAEDFESGNLNAWQDGVDPTRHRVVLDSGLAHSGGRYLDVTYPAGSDGGWLTRFFMPGYDSLYVSYYVRFPTNWEGTTKLIAFYGSRTDDQWSAFGKAGKCPNGTDFFAAMLVTDPVGSDAATRFYSYYPAMAREPDGVTCWGRFGDGSETYAPSAMSLGVWHHVEYWVKLNTPGQSDAIQKFWIDGVERGSWSGLSFRSGSILTLNAVQLTFSTGGAPQTQHVYVDELVVTTNASGGAPTAAAPGMVTDLAVVGATDTSVTLSFSEVDDGTGKPASYDVRSAAGSITWWLAESVTQGSCATPVRGSGIGAQRTCTVTGLSPATSYQFQLVAYRGTLDVDAVFGELSNVASDSTLASPPADAPVSAVTVSPAPGTVKVGQKLQLKATTTDSAGGVLSGRVVTWASSAPAIATVSTSGLVTGLKTGKATITATSEGVPGRSTITVTAIKPGTVKDLAVVGTTASSVTLSFTEVHNGTGRPAKYDVRVAVDTMEWGSAASVTAGTCTTPVQGTVIGAKATCTVTGLAASTKYQFQLVAYRGTLNVNAVFGPLSNIAAASTLAQSSAPAPVATVVVSPATVSQSAGTTQQLGAVLKDATGTILTDRVVTWASNNAAVATVNQSGLETSVAAGTATIKATSEGISGTAAITVTVTKPGTVNDLKIAGTTDSSVTLSFVEVGDGTGLPASYDVRYSVSPISWGSAPSVTQGTCTTPVAGTTIGVSRSCTVLGLASSTAYQFQLVAFRGTLDVNAVFGGLSNIASGTTTSSSPPPPPPAPPPPPPPAPPPPPSTGAWPNEPAGFRMFNDQPWDLLTSNGWNYLRRASSKDANITLDAAAPLSPAKQLHMVFTTDMGNDNEPSVHWIGLPGVREIYTAWWIKLSPNWKASPAGAGKITFLFTPAAGQVYTGFYHKDGDPSSGWVNGPPYRIGLNTEWGPYGQRVWLPNATTTYLNPGEWHRIEVYYRWETTPGTSGDGIIRWWVDGALNGNYTTVHYPASSFNEFQFAPTLQNPPPAEQSMYVDHTYVSVP